MPETSAATQASFEWTPNVEPDLAGYRIFSREQSQPYDYADPAWEGMDAYCTIYNLDESKPYCFVARAFDTEGFESEDSMAGLRIQSTALFTSCKMNLQHYILLQ